jgi:hypothetical protein
MNDPIHSHDDRMPDWYDPFDELRTTPPGWELAEPKRQARATPKAVPGLRGPAKPPAALTQPSVSLN